VPAIQWHRISPQREMAGLVDSYTAV